MELPRQIFECLKCGHLTLLLSIPAQCRSCKGGNGVVRPVEPGDNAELLSDTVPPPPPVAPDKP
jgi:hypothetical protein